MKIRSNKKKKRRILIWTRYIYINSNSLLRWKNDIRNETRRKKVYFLYFNDMITDNFNNCNELQRIKISLIKYQLRILVFMHISFSFHLLLLLLRSHVREIFLKNCTPGSQALHTRSSWWFQKRKCRFRSVEPIIGCGGGG